MRGSWLRRRRGTEVLAAGLLVGAVACGSPGGNPDGRPPIDTETDIDAKSDAPSNLTTLTIDTLSAPIFAAYRDGTGAWRTPVAIGPGRYTFGATNDYTFVAVCGSAQAGYDTEVRAATVADGTSPLMFCFDLSTPATVDVTGTMDQAGTVDMSDEASSTTAPWTFDLKVAPGTHDLTAIGATGRMLMRRNQSIGSSATEPTIDVVADGTAMTTVALTVSNAMSDEAISHEVDLSTQNDYAVLEQVDGTTARFAPAALLEPTDDQTVRVRADSSGSVRSISASYAAGDGTAFTLPPRLSGISFTRSAGGAVTASWSATLPDYADVDLYVDGGATVFDNSHVQATASWALTTSATSVSFDTSAIPGYDASWAPSLAGGYLQQFGISQDAAAGSGWSSVFENVNAFAGPGRPRASEVRARRARSGSGVEPWRAAHPARGS
jgi:hypothetical protein